MWIPRYAVIWIENESNFHLFYITLLKPRTMWQCKSYIVATLFFPIIINLKIRLKICREHHWKSYFIERLHKEKTSFKFTSETSCAPQNWYKTFCWCVRYTKIVTCSCWIHNKIIRSRSNSSFCYKHLTNFLITWNQWSIIFTPRMLLSYIDWFFSSLSFLHFKNAKHVVIQHKNILFWVSLICLKSCLDSIQ